MIVGRLCQTPFIIFSNSAAVSMSILPTRTGAPFGPSPKIETHRFAGNRLSNRMNTHEGRCAFSKFWSGRRIKRLCVRRSMLDVERWMFSADATRTSNIERSTSNVQSREEKSG
jgi:hypothetical protein